jgi:hypothetical protein
LELKIHTSGAINIRRNNKKKWLSDPKSRALHCQQAKPVPKNNYRFSPPPNPPNPVPPSPSPVTTTNSFPSFTDPSHHILTASSNAPHTTLQT